MKKRLGLGLEGLLGNTANAIHEISLSEIKAANWQPRKTFELEALNELAASIKEHGVLQPVMLKKVADGYEIVIGERRVRACKLLELKTIPAILNDSEQDKLLQIAMIENLQRQDLNPIEKAEGFSFLIEKLNLTQEELAKKIGVSRPYIANYLRINSLSEEIKEKIAKGEMSYSHGKILASKKNADVLAKDVVSGKMSVHELEKKFKNSNKNSNEEIARFEELIKQAFPNIEVKIALKNKNGSVNLGFSSIEQLEEIIDKLCDL